MSTQPRSESVFERNAALNDRVRLFALRVEQIADRLLGPVPAATSTATEAGAVPQKGGKPAVFRALDDDIYRTREAVETGLHALTRIEDSLP